MVPRNLFFWQHKVFHASSYHPGASGLNALLGHDYTASINAPWALKIGRVVGLRKISFGGGFKNWRKNHTKRNGKDLEVGGFGRIGLQRKKNAENVAENSGVKLFFSTLVTSWGRFPICLFSLTKFENTKYSTVDVFCSNDCISSVKLASNAP